MNTIINSLHNAAEAVIETIHPAPHTVSDLPRKQVIGMEEAERTLRMADYSAPQEQLAQQNAAKMSSFIKEASTHPRNKSLGFKQVTGRLEQQERARLLQSKSELAFRRTNAGKVANMIRSLGWPFYNGGQSGPVYFLADESSLAEDEERTYRMNNPLQAQVAKKNAAQVANAIRWGLPSHHLGGQRGLKGFTHHLEEKERQRQITDEDGHHKAAHGAFQVADMIRSQGWPLYVAGKNAVDSLEDGERIRRLADKDEQQLARDHANRVSSLLPEAEANFAQRVPSDVIETPKRSVEHDGLHNRQDTNLAYEQERNLRMHDQEGQETARKNAANVAAMLMAAKPAEKKYDITEQERLNRMHDRPLQLTAMKNARAVSNLIKENRFPSDKPANWTRQMEKERNRRMVDPQQQNRQALARQVSSMIAERPNPQLSSFTAPRDVSPSLPFAQELLEKRPAVAPTASSSLGATPVASHPALPFTEELLEHRPAYGGSLPFTHELLEKRPAAELSLANPAHASLPFEQELLGNRPSLRHAEPVARSAPVAPISAPLSSAPLPLSAATTPVASIEPMPSAFTPSSTPMPSAFVPSTAPLAKAMPFVSAPVAPISAPIYSAPVVPPMSSAPMTAPMAPISTPIAPVSAPMYSAPMVPPMAAPVASSQPHGLLSNIMAPIASRVMPLLRSQSANNTSMPSALPMSQAPMAPTYGTTPLSHVSSFGSPATSTYLPTYVPAVAQQPSVYSSMPAAAHFPEATYYSAAGAHAMTNKQLQRLQRQAERHDRKAEREAKRAQHDAMKAQKLHMRGKDNRAEKKEARAAQHEIAAKNHQQWASEIMSKQQVPVAPASSFVGYANM